MTDYRRNAPLPRRALVASVALLLTAAAPATGQETILSDVTGPAVTTGDQLAAMFAEPGTVRSMYCPVAWGVRTAAASVSQQLGASTLQPVILRYGRELSSAPQRRVLALLTSPDAAATDAMVGALAPAENRQAQGAARRLVREARGLFDVLETIDPLRPGTAGATRLSGALGAYNSYIDASSADFLARAPEELTALHAVMNSLVIATLENERRAVDVRSVDARGLACAAAIPPREEVVTTPIEHALEICLLIDREFQVVTALWRPDSGDTLALVQGERRPFSEVRSRATAPVHPEWLATREPVTINSVEYVPFGVPRTVRPGEMTSTGELDGASYFVARNERGDAAPRVYFPVGPNCVVQPYQPVETIQVRG